jgi:hypothetical protein
MSNKSLSPESAREARKFFLSPSGQEFLQYMAERRPTIQPSPEVHNFSFSAGRPAGYDAYAQNIDDVLNPDLPDKPAKRDSIHS